jgi:hypothetical protein
LKRSRSATTSANGSPRLIMSRSCCSSVRRLISPVRPSVGRLELGPLEGADGSDPGAGLRRQRRQLRHLGRVGRLVLRAGRVQDAEGTPMKPTGTHTGRARAAFAVAQLRAGVQRLAGLEHDRIAASAGDARERRTARGSPGPQRRGRPRARGSCGWSRRAGAPSAPSARSPTWRAR